MEATKNDKWRNLVNSSGFPLQISLVHQIEKERQRDGWKTLLTEHPWRHPASGDEGFIDLVVENQHKTVVMVVECKRVRDTEWFFLAPDDASPARRVISTWFTYICGYKTKRYGWQDHPGEPRSYQPEFCIVHGQDAKSRPMLERVAAQVIESTEALAHEEFSFFDGTDYVLRMYYSVIVTSAQLKICRFRSEDIDPATGDIAEAVFEPVPWLRFRKTLTSPSNSPGQAQTIVEKSRDSERTVFVVNSSYFIEFLREWSPDSLAGGALT